MAPTRSVVSTATATIDAGSGTLYSVHICAGADAATATLRKGGSGGTIVAKVGAGIGLSASHAFVGGVDYTDLHLTVTGTTPVVVVEI